MAMTAKIDGMDEISEMLTALEEEAPKAAAAGLYSGAGEMAKAIYEAAKQVKTAPFKYAKGGEKRLPSPEEKEVLLQAGFGVAKFDRNGSEVNTSVGFNDDGYADVSWNHMSSGARTNYKAVSVKGHASNSASFLRAIGHNGGGQNQKPIGMIANAINSGTSFMQKQPFFRQGVSKGTKKAETAIKNEIEQRLDKKTKT